MEATLKSGEEDEREFSFLLLNFPFYILIGLSSLDLKRNNHTFPAARKFELDACYQADSREPE